MGLWPVFLAGLRARATTQSARYTGARRFPSLYQHEHTDLLLRLARRYRRAQFAACVCVDEARETMLEPSVSIADCRPAGRAFLVRTRVFVSRCCFCGCPPPEAGVSAWLGGGTHVRHSPLCQAGRPGPGRARARARFKWKSYAKDKLVSIGIATS